MTPIGFEFTLGQRAPDVPLFRGKAISASPDLGRNLMICYVIIPVIWALMKEIQKQLGKLQAR